MENEARRIEVFAPFGTALELTKRILFQPFDLGKWCVIGFAAFLANLGSGGVRFNYGNRSSDLRGSWRGAMQDGVNFLESLPFWVIVLMVVGAVLLVAIAFLVAWLRARGQFIFIDAVVRNRAAIVEPWQEFKREGNRLFLFRLVVGLGFLCLFALAGMPLWWSFWRRGEVPEGVALWVGILAVLGAALVLLGWWLASWFMVPIMYRRRCGPVQGLRESIGLGMAKPGPVCLFLLFNLVLALATFLLMCAVTCLTCCLAALPYVGTVILLPVYVFWLGYLLLFMRQFGADYDLWAGLAPSVPMAPPPSEPPPLPA